MDRQAIAPTNSGREIARKIVEPFGNVAFVYADMGSLGVQERDLRWRRQASILLEQGAAPPLISQLADRVVSAPEAPATLALFADADGTVLHEQKLTGTRLPDQAGFTSPAAIGPLLTWIQDRPSYVLAVADRAGAQLSASSGGGAPARVWSVTGPDDEIEHNAPGGWSQARYQRRGEDSWARNADYFSEQVSAAIAAVGAQVLLLSGEGRTVELLTKKLPANESLLVRHLSGGRSPDGSQAGRHAAVEHALRDAAMVQTGKLLDRHREQLSPAGHAVEGYYDTIAALAAGEVATLLVSTTATPELIWFGESGTEIYTNHDSALVSQRPMRSGTACDVAIRATLLSGGQVRIIPEDASGAPLDNIGALCHHL